MGMACSRFDDSVLLELSSNSKAIAMALSCHER